MLRLSMILIYMVVKIIVCFIGDMLIVNFVFGLVKLILFNIVLLFKFKI